ncbi:MAG: YdjY domain-containing protein [Tissierellia bacterium]|nr:YdjY domain-containing protein [Tissierellia bacterium]
MKNKLVCISLLALLTFSACSKENTTENSSNPEPISTKSEISVENQKESKVTEDEPIVIDKENKTISLYAKLNKRFLKDPSRHLVISDSGKLSDKAIFTSIATPEEFYNALKEIGAKPGDNMTEENAETTTVEGDKLEMYVKVNGKEINIEDALEKSTDKPIDLRFGGNLDYSKQYNTGCMVCLDSCYVGIVSNASYTLGAIEDRKEVSFKANNEQLSDVEGPVELDFQLK